MGVSFSLTQKTGGDTTLFARLGGDATEKGLRDLGALVASMLCRL